MAPLSSHLKNMSYRKKTGGDRDQSLGEPEKTSLQIVAIRSKMIRQFLDDKTGSTAIDYGPIVQHHRI
jgi:hypothetical protein